MYFISTGPSPCKNKSYHKNSEDFQERPMPRRERSRAANPRGPYIPGRNGEKQFERCERIIL
jgi:hypothetical protein